MKNLTFPTLQGLILEQLLLSLVPFATLLVPIGFILGTLYGPFWIPDGGFVSFHWKIAQICNFSKCKVWLPRDRTIFVIWRRACSAHKAALVAIRTAPMGSISKNNLLQTWVCASPNALVYSKQIFVRFLGCFMIKTGGNSILSALARTHINGFKYCFVAKTFWDRICGKS